MTFTSATVAQGALYGVRPLQDATRLDVILERFPVTLSLAGLSVLLSVLLALPIGILSAIRRSSLLDGLAMLLGHAEALPVQVDHSVEVCDGHSDVVDPFEHGASFKQPPHPRNVPRLPL